MSYDYQGGRYGTRTYGSQNYGQSQTYGQGGYGQGQYQGQIEQRGQSWGGMIQDNTVPLALIGIGIGWLLLSGGSQSEDDSRHGYGQSAFGRSGRWSGDRSRGLYDQASGRVSQAMHSLRDGAEHLRERAGETFDYARQRAEDAVEQARERFGGRSGEHNDTGAGYDRIADYDSREEDAVYGSSTSYASYGRSGGQGGGSSWMGGTTQRARGLVHGAGERASYANDSFWDMVEQHPLAAGLLGLAFGAAVGVTLPSTRTEDEWLGRYRDDLTEDLRERGMATVQQVTQIAKDAVRAGAEAARETAEREAQERGLTGQDDNRGAASPRSPAGADSR